MLQGSIFSCPRKATISGGMQVLFDFAKILKEAEAYANNLKFKYFPADSLEKFIEINLNSTFPDLSNDPVTSLLCSIGAKVMHNNYASEKEATEVSKYARFFLECDVYTDGNKKNFTEKILCDFYDKIEALT